MSVLRRSVCLSQYVVTSRIKSNGSHVGCPSTSKKYLPIAYTRTPETKAIEKEPTPQARFPEVWRHRSSAAIQLTSTPEARSLTCL